MTVSVAHRLARRLLDHLDAGGTTDHADDVLRIPAANYADETRWRHECDVVFRHTPLAAALSTELREPGQYKVLDLAGRSVIVVRGDDGEARVFVNQCRHRAAELLEGRGSARRFACSYHGWTYDTAGALVGVPSEVSFCGLDRGDHGLFELPVREELGLIWTAGSPDVDLASADLYGGMEDELRELDLHSWHFQYTEPLPGNLHWRLNLEATFETYHLPFLHRATANDVFYSNTIAWDAFGRNFRYAWPRRSIDSLRGIPDDEWENPGQHMNIIYFLFPNATLLHNAGMFQSFPGTAPNRSTFHFNFCTMGGDGEMTEAQHKRFEFAVDVTRDEDLPAGEAGQRNFQANPTTDIVFGTNEVGLQHLHRNLDALLV